MAAAAETTNSNHDKPIASDSFTLYSFVDEVESRVEALRKKSTALMGEQLSLVSIIKQLKNYCLSCDIPSEDCQELVANMERLRARCEAVEIFVHTVRDDGQVQALDKVNRALEDLSLRLGAEDKVAQQAVKLAHTYLNACLPEALGAVDTRFQSMVLGCALDDQKNVRRRLESLVREGKDPGCVTVRRRENAHSLEQSEKAGRSSDSGHQRALPAAPQGSSGAVEVAGRSVAAAGDDDSPGENHLTEQFYSTSSVPAIAQPARETLQQFRSIKGGDESHNSGAFKNS